MINKQIRVLIADDDKDDVDFLKEAFNDLLPNSQVDNVCDGISALRHIKTLPPPDVVFLDLNMPLKNGLNCLIDIYNHELLPGKPIFIYSTSSNMKDIDEAYKHDATFYIVKPGSFKGLCEIIKRALAVLEKPTAGKVEKANFVLSEAKLRSSDSPASAF